MSKGFTSHNRNDNRSSAPIIDKEQDEDYVAECTFVQNFQLAAWEGEIGVIWKTGPYLYNPRFMHEVGVVPGEKIVGVLQVGYPLVIPEAKPRTPIEQKLTIIDSMKSYEGATMSVRWCSFLICADHS